jgi:hypothetical protein
MTTRQAGALGVLLAVAVGVAAGMAGAAWAQEAPPPESVTKTIYGGSPIVAGVGAVAGSIVYAPFKALILCPLSAVASGVAYAATRGGTDTSESLLRLGCTGTYVISPAMVQGHEAFQRYDER